MSGSYINLSTLNGIGYTAFVGQLLHQSVRPCLTLRSTNLINNIIRCLIHQSGNEPILFLVHSTRRAMLRVQRVCVIPDL